MSGRVLVASVICLGLAGCADKISMSSEVGGSGSRSLVSSVTSPGAGGGGTSGLGVTGNEGVLGNVLGTDPVGGLLEAGLGQGNLVSAILGSTGGTGLLPSAAAVLAGESGAELTGLGIFGSGGLVSDLAGTDLLGGALDTSGVLGASLAGGNDGLLGSILDAQGIGAPLASLTQPLTAALPGGTLPLNTLTEGLSSAPALGVTGSGGLVADLIGVDLVGNLVGTNNPLSGGNSGLVGNLVPVSEPPLGVVGDAATGVLGIVSGSQSSPLAGALEPAMPGLGALLGGVNNTVGGVAAPAQQVLGSAPVLGDLLGTPATPAPGAAQGGVLEPVTGVISSVPVVGDALAPVTGALGGLGGLLGRR